MASNSFCQAAIAELISSAEKLSKKHPQLFHMLVMPKGEQVWLPRGGGHPIGSGPIPPPPKKVTFGNSRVATVIPSKKAWPKNIAPLIAIAAEQECSPYIPLSREPYRVHLFFGKDCGKDLLSLAQKIGELRPELTTAMHNDIMYHSGETHGREETIFDDWFCTMHWWAWKATDSPIHCKPKVEIAGKIMEVEPLSSSDRMRFSFMPHNVFHLSAETLRLFQRFFDVPPDMRFTSTYPPPKKRATEEMPSRKSAPEADNAPPTPSNASANKVNEPTVLYSAFVARLGFTTATVGKYARAAGVPTPGRGQHNFRIKESQQIPVLQKIVDEGNSAADRQKAENVLREIASEIELKSKIKMKSQSSKSS